MALRRLSPKLQSIAKKELNEDPSEVPKYLKHIQEWLTAQPHLNIRSDDQYLITFLRGCKYNIEKAKKKIETFCAVNIQIPEIFSNRDPFSPKIQKLLELGVCLPLPKTLNCSDMPVLLIQYQNINSREIHILDVIKVVTMTVDIIIEEQDSATVVGFQSINDLRHIPIIYMMQMTPRVTKKVFKCYQEAYPARPKKMHFINLPLFFKHIFNFIKPFIGEKFNKRIHLYSNSELDHLHQHFPRSILPEEYGGDDGPLHDMANKWKKKMESYRQWFLNYDFSHASLK